MYAIKSYEPAMDKIMRLHSVTSTIENGFVHLPDKACWLSEYIHELIIFPKGKNDDQADSTSQALDWFKQRYVSPKEPWSMAFKYEPWTRLSGEFSGSDSPCPGALARDSGLTRVPSFGRY